MSEPWVDADPLAGEDEAWAPEDAEPQPVAEDDPTRFFVGVAVGLLLSALAWLALAGLVLAAVLR